MYNLESQKKQENYRVCLLGAALDTGNMGVSALSASLIKLIIDTKPNADITLIIGNRSSKPQSVLVNGKKTEIKVSNYRMSPKAPLNKQLFWILLIAFLQRIIPVQIIRKKIINSNPLLNTLIQADLIGNIRGGDSFSDIYGLSKFLMGSVPNFIIFLLKKKIILLPQTYGPFNTILAKKIAKYIFNNSLKIYSRDKYSIKIVSEILQNNDKVIDFCPDVAFTLEVSFPKKINIYPPINIEENRQFKLIGINVNGLMYNGGYTGKNMFGLNLDYQLFIREVIKSLLKINETKILLVPHTFATPGNVNSDPDACREIFDELHKKNQNKIHMVSQIYDQHNIKGIINKCDFFIGSRMHACIAALSQNIPTIGVAYSRKFIGVFESVGVGDWVIDAKNENNSSAEQIVLEKYNFVRNSKKDFNYHIDIIKNQIKDTFKNLLAKSY